MPESRLRWGLLSTANINRRLIPAIRAAERAELTTVASRDRSTAEAYAAKWQIPKAHGSYEALLADPGIDAVYISPPNSLHAEWAIKAARAGKHVLCEKPLAVTLEDCSQIAAAAGEAGVVVVEAVMHLYHPIMHRLRALVVDGAIGRVQLLRGSFCFPLDRPDNVRWRPELGGGSLWDVGSYPVSFMRWVAGEPAEVFGWQKLSESGVDATFAGLLRYEGGALGVFDSGFSGQFGVSAEVVGSEGALFVERPYILNRTSRLWLVRGDEREEVAVEPADPYQCEVEALTAAVLDGADLPVSLSRSRANVATILALYESARLGRPVAIGEER